MLTQRKLGRTRTLPPPSRGQFGPNHTAVEVIRPQEWEDADPFILLMDDRAHGKLQAGPHPHAGFETVTFMVDGDMPAEHAGAPRLAPGDVEWTTAGSGIVHGPDPDKPIDGRLRILQLWLTLPKADRWTAPDHQFIRRSEAPAHVAPGVEVRLYSGTLGTLVGPARNRVPVTLADITLAPGAATSLQVPASHNGFFYVLDGEARVGGDPLATSQVGWLDRLAGDEDTEVRIANPGSTPLRVLFYAGARQSIPIAWYGPFIGDTEADIQRSIARYRSGTFVRV